MPGQCKKQSRQERKKNWKTWSVGVKTSQMRGQGEGQGEGDKGSSMGNIPTGKALRPQSYRHTVMSFCQQD